MRREDYQRAPQTFTPTLEEAVPDVVTVGGDDADFYDNLDFEAQERVRVRYDNRCLLL